MKRIEAVIQPDMLEPVIKALRKVGVGGFSVIEANGQGAAEPVVVAAELVVVVGVSDSCTLPEVVFDMIEISAYLYLVADRYLLHNL